MVAARRPSSEILDALCELVHEEMPEAFAIVMRVDDGVQTLSIRNAPNLPPEMAASLGSLTPGPHGGSCGAAVHERQVVIVPDTEKDPRWQNLRQFARRFGIRACWSIPIYVDEDDIGGTFAISLRTPGEPTDQQHAALELVGYLAGVVLRVERAEDSLLKQRSMLRAVIDSSEDPIFVKDRDGRYLLVNDAEAKHRGVPSEQMIGLTDRELYGKDEIATCTEYDRKVLESGASIQHEMEIVSKSDGKTREYLVRKDPLRDMDGNVAGVVGAARDVTERRQTERAMQQAQKLESLGVLAGGIAHDFNNLLVGMLANVSMLEQDERIRSLDILEGLSDIRLAATRASELTNQLLQYAGKRTPERSPFSVADAFAEVSQLLNSSISKRVRLRTECDPSLPTIHADPVQIRQVILNLVVNASDAYENGEGEVNVRVSAVCNERPRVHTTPNPPLQRRDWILIEVVDHGAGMDRDTVNRIFDPFFTTKATGRGLGLAAVLGIVSAHQGCMDVESKPGSGTTFRVWLPAESAESAPSPRKVDTPANPDARRVLLVEDEVLVERVLTRILHHAGYEVIPRRDGNEGLSTFDEDDVGFDLAIIDVTMPGLDGHQLAQAMRDRNETLPIVLTSGRSAMDIDHSPEFAAHDAFLAKPYTPNDVFTAVNQAVATREARCETPKAPTL